MITTEQQLEYLQRKLDHIRLTRADMTSNMNEQLLHEEERKLLSLIALVKNELEMVA